MKQLSKEEIPEKHTEIIKCPECGEIQEAEVEHTSPFGTYVHHCVKCKYIIMESEWEKLPYQKEFIDYLKKYYPHLILSEAQKDTEISRLQARVKELEGEAVEFAEWIGKHYPNQHLSDGIRIWQPAFLHPDFNKKHTTEQLYSIYKQSKSTTLTTKQ